MAIDTKPNFSNKKFEQCVGDVMNLSGCTQIYGYFDIEDSATLTICNNAGVGKVLTSNATGIASWQTPITGETGTITSISAGDGMEFSEITTTGTITLGTPTSITSGSTDSIGANTHSHTFSASTFVTGTEGILADENNHFIIDSDYVTDLFSPTKYSYTGITSNQSIGILPSGTTMGIVYLNNRGTETVTINIATTTDGDDITPYQPIDIAPNEDVSLTINMRVSLTENKVIYINSDNWTDVILDVEWAYINYRNSGSINILPGDVPVATETTTGIVKIGEGLGVDGEGLISVTGGTGSEYVFNNGINENEGVVGLGGSLTGNTDINLNGNNYNVTFDNTASGCSYVRCIGNSKTIQYVLRNETNILSGLESTNQFLRLVCHVNNETRGELAVAQGGAGIGVTSTSGGTYICTNIQGICVKDDISDIGMFYGGNYSGNGATNPRWIPDAAWVTGQTSGGGGGISWSGTTANGIATYVDSSTVCSEPKFTIDTTTDTMCMGIATRLCGTNIGYVNLTVGVIGGQLELNQGAGLFECCRNCTLDLKGAGLYVGTVIYGGEANHITVSTPSNGYMYYAQDTSLIGSTNPRWIPDAEWVTGQTGGGGGGISWDGTTANGIATYVDSSTVCSEPNLTFNGTDLTVNGKICTSTLLVSTGAASGCVLTSDANGNATWETPTGGGTTYTSSNGICKVGSNFKLGGLLTENTSFNINDKRMLSYGASNFGTQLCLDLDASDEGDIKMWLCEPPYSTTGNKINTHLHCSNCNFNYVCDSVFGYSITEASTYCYCIKHIDTFLPSDYGGQMFIDTNGISISGTSVNLCGLPSQTTSNVLYYNSTTGKVTYGSSSDCRLKCNLEPIDVSSSSILDDICGYKFEYSDQSNQEGEYSYGLIAQDVEKHFPLAVSDTIFINDKTFKSLSYDKMIPIMWNIIKEQEKRIKLLEGGN